MRKLYLLSTLLLNLLVGSTLLAQDFSNKGKDFWVGYGYHQQMTNGGGGGTQDMVLYFATEAVTNVTVSIPGIGYSKTYNNIPANSVFTSDIIPKTGAQDARLTGESTSAEKKGIHITSDRPIVAYAHIYNQSVSGATILFPTSTLGKEYYSVNYKNISNSPDANCWFYVIACDTGQTTVEITPSVSTLNHVPGVPFTVTLKQGEIYNIMAKSTSDINPYQTGDLTGSKIQSIASASGGCKRIAVFSGSGRISITCTGTSSSSDNYMVQSFPKNAWGKKYLTSPTGGVMRNNIYRICVLDPTTVVKINGSVTGLPFQGNFFYEIAATANPQLIEADKPIMVVQYVTSQGACGNGSMPGDPEVIYLSPVEQNINRVLWNATPNFAIEEHYYNVIIPNTGTAISSFKIDGIPVPAVKFAVHPQASGYSYLTQAVMGGQHVITSDSGFNAIAYGFGNAESYGYNAGTNVRDLYQFVTVKNPFAVVNFAATCKNTPFTLSMTFPYEPTQIKWTFGAALNAMGLTDVTVNSPVYDSTWTVNGKQLYRYKLPSSYNIAISGTYPIKITADNPGSDGCGGTQEIDYDLEAYSTPTSDFSFVNDGCASSPVIFTSNANTDGRTAVLWSWNFGDGGTAAITNPTHTYAGSGLFTVKYSLITDIGCISDTVSKVVKLDDIPAAKFDLLSTTCAGKAITFRDLSTVVGNSGTISKWTWDFGDGSALVNVFSSTNQLHIYNNPGTYTVTLKVESSSGCQSFPYSASVTIHVNPVADFALPSICLPSGTANFTSNASISDGSQALLNYAWNFGDGGTANSANPVHNYSSTGPFNVTLTVTSNNGCTNIVTKPLTTVYAQPQADFSLDSLESCLGGTSNFTDHSTAPAGTVTQWFWDFGDGTNSNDKNPNKQFAGPGGYKVKLYINSAAGCRSDTMTRTVTVLTPPTVSFAASSAACETSNLLINSTSVANGGTISQYTWTINSAVQPGNAASVNYFTSAAGNYTVNLSLTTSKGCFGQASSVITVNSKPRAGFISPQVCISDPTASFVDTSKINLGSIAGWDWNFGDASASAGNPNTSTVQNPDHHYTSVGAYTASVIVTGSTGCKDTASQTFTVNGSSPLAGFTIIDNAKLCSNKIVSVVDGSIVDFGKLIKVEVYWDYDNDPTIKITDSDPVPGKTYTHTYPEFGSPASKNYTIRYVTYSGTNCINTLTKSINVLATPSIQFDALQPLCSDAASFLITKAQVTNGLSGTGGYSGPGIVSTNGSFSPAEAGSGILTLRYTFDADNGCSSFAEQNIEVYPTPGVNAGPDKVVLQGGFVTLSPALNASFPVTYSWSPATGIKDPTVAFAEASPTEDMTYTLTVTSEKGCKASDQVFVKLLKEPVVPNIFSPNGDGVHDKWIIQFLESYPGCIVEIYNRYGQMVFHSTGYSQPWDGTINGKQAPIGTYYYIVDPKNGRKKIAGYVDLIR